MFQKVVSLFVFLSLVFVSTGLYAAAQTPEDFYERGMQAARRGEYPKALQHFRHAIEQEAGFAKAHAALGTIHLQLGDFTDAEIAFKCALAIAPDLLQAEANLALLYTKADRLDDAINIYENLLRKHPDSLRVWLGIGSAYQRADRFAEAIEAYRECLTRSPNLPEVITNLASCYEAIEQQAQAIHYYKTALGLAPNLPMANGNLGAIYQQQGELDKALPLLEKAVRLNPHFTAARYRLGLVLTKKREFQRAAALYQQVIAQQRDHVGAYYNLAQALFRLKRSAEGKRAMEIYRRLNAIAQEIDTRERATLAEPSNPIRQHQLGLAYAKYGKTAKAITAFQAALKRDGSAHYALNALARLYILQGVQLEDAIAYAEKAFRLVPAPQYLHTLALAYFQTGAQESALKAIQAAIKMEPKNKAFQQTLTEIKSADEKTQ